MDNGVNRWVLDRPMLNSYMYKLRCAFHGHLMISDKLPVPFFVTSLSLCGRGAHIPTEFGANIFVIPQTLTLPEIQYGGRRRLGFSWKVTLARCGLMRVSCSNISHSRWDWNTFVLNVRLMTSCELTFGCIIGREHTSVSMALVFLHTKFGVINIFIHCVAWWRQWQCLRCVDIATAATMNCCKPSDRAVHLPRPRPLVVWILVKISLVLDE